MKSFNLIFLFLLFVSCNESQFGKVKEVASLEKVTDPEGKVIVNVELVKGCIDKAADNFDSLAKSDDGSCKFSGCKDIKYKEFDALVDNHDQAKCLNLIITDCGDSAAVNFNAAADVIDNKLCKYSGCKDIKYKEYNALADINDPAKCINLKTIGCGDVKAANYIALLDVIDNKLCKYSGCKDIKYKEYNALADISDPTKCINLKTIGCGDVKAANYMAVLDVIDNKLCKYSGCKDIKYKEYNALADISDPTKCINLIKIEDTLVKCQQAAEQGKLVKVTRKVTFPEAKECAWGENGNLDKMLPGAHPWLAARTEQKEVVSIDDGFTVCDIEFKSEKQAMNYDDEILLLLGDIVLFSSVDYSEEHRLAFRNEYVTIQNGRFANIYQYTDGLVVEDGLVKYTWLGLNGLIDNRNLAASDPRPQYCLGNSECIIPESDTEGEIKLDIPQLEILKAAKASGVKVDEVGKSELAFSFVTTGDDDYGDCYHKDFNFDVEITGYQFK